MADYNPFPVAKVVAIHPERHSLDCVCLDTGERFFGVTVLSGSASSEAVSASIPEPAPPQESWGIEPGDGATVLVVLARWPGITPWVLGFIPPPTAPGLNDPGRKADRHQSGWYHTVSPTGDMEMHHPSGSFVRMASDLGHENLDAFGPEGRWADNKNVDHLVGFVASIAGAGGAEVAKISVAPTTGAISLSTFANGASAAAIEIDPVAGTVAITTLPAALATLNGSPIVNGSVVCPYIQGPHPVPLA